MGNAHFSKVLEQDAITFLSLGQNLLIYITLNKLIIYLIIAYVR